MTPRDFAFWLAGYLYSKRDGMIPEVKDILQALHEVDVIKEAVLVGDDK